MYDCDLQRPSATSNDIYLTCLEALRHEIEFALLRVGHLSFLPAKRPVLKLVLRLFCFDFFPNILVEYNFKRTSACDCKQEYIGLGMGHAFLSA